MEGDAFIVTIADSDSDFGCLQTTQCNFTRECGRSSLEYCRQHNVTLQENVEDNKPIIVLEDVKVTLNGRKEVNVFLLLQKYY